MDDDAGVEIFHNLTPAQWGIAGAGFCLLLVSLVLNCCLKNRRWRAIQSARGGLVTAEFLTLRDIPKHARELVLQEALRERATRVVPAWRDDCGWGAPGSPFDGVHFKTVIGSSLHVLERFAVRRDAALKACPAVARATDDFAKSQLACDVEAYLESIRVSLAGELDGDLCRQYLAFFRNARTPGRECSEQEFRAFLGVLQEILRRLER